MKNAKTMDELVPKTIETLTAMEIRKSRPERSEKSSIDEPGRKPKRRVSDSAWQRKWFDLDVFDPKVRRMADKAEAYCHRFFHNNKDKTLLIIAGPSGTGKTHVARKLHDYGVMIGIMAWTHGHWSEVPRTTCMNWAEIVAELKDRQQSYLDEMMMADLLILDDVGAERDPWGIGKDTLCQVLTRRERRFTVITTNATADEWGEKWDRRIADRLFRNSDIIELSGVESYSLK